VTSEKKSYKFPKSLPLCAKRLATLTLEAEAVEAQLKPLKEEETALRDYLLETFKKTELDGMKAHGLSFAIVTTRVPSITDWDKFLKFAFKNSNADLLNKSVNSPAWRERMNDGKPVPGVEPFDRVALRVGKVKPS
jgi:hypothetical protein